MKFGLAFCLIIFILSCAKNEDGVSQPGTKLLSIDIDESGHHITENYFYNADALQPRLIQMTSGYNSYDLEYDGGRLFQIKVTNAFNNRIDSKDSIAYNESGLIDKIYFFSLNNNHDLEIFQWYEYKYDSLLRISERNTFWDNNISRWHEKYYWKDNAIERVNEYDENFDLEYSFFYLYDKKHNYKRNLPTWIDDPVYWSDNNVTLMWFYDYVGNLDAHCNPCQYSYYYNRDGYPYKINTNWEYSVELHYE